MQSGTRLLASAAVLVSGVLASGCAARHNVQWDAKPAAAAAPTVAAVAAGPEAEGDELWKSRGEPAKLAQALALWEEAARQGLTSKLAVKLARGHYLMGDGHHFLAGDIAARDAEYQKGLDWATQALKLTAPKFAEAMAAGKTHAEAISLADREAVESMYWFATNLGKWAATKGFATKLRYKDDIKNTMLRVKELDDRFFYAAAWRYFGSFEAATHGLAGGSLEKSEENFKRAVELAPNYLGTKVLWADYLCVKKRDQETFKRLLEEVKSANADIDPEISPENRIEQRKAEKLLAEIEDKF